MLISHNQHPAFRSKLNQCVDLTIIKIYQLPRARQRHAKFWGQAGERQLVTAGLLQMRCCQSVLPFPRPATAYQERTPIA